MFIAVAAFSCVAKSNRLSRGEERIKRLAAGLLLSLISGIVFQILFRTPVPYHIVVTIIAIAASFWKRQFMYLAIWSLAAAYVHLSRPQESKLLEEKYLTVSGIVIGEECYEDFSKLQINIDKIILSDTVDYLLPVEYYVYRRGSYLGRRLTIRGRISPGRVAYRPARLAGRIVESTDGEHIFGMLLRPIRTYIDRLIMYLFDGQGYAVASGLALGGSGRLGRELKDTFSRAGILHILAVSGLHVGFVGAFLGIILLFIPMSHRVKFSIVMCGLFLYAGVTGFRPSVCRATGMAFLFGLAVISQRNVDGIHIVNLTAITFLLVKPMLLLDVGAQLSFGAVYGILYLFPKIENGYIRTMRRRSGRLLLRMMAVSFSAQVFVAPLLLFYFNRLSPYAVIANLVVIPLASAIIFMLLLCFSVGWLCLDLARMIAFPAGILINVLIASSNLFARMPFSALNLSVSPLLLFPLYLLVWKRIRKCVMWTVMVIALLFSLAHSVNCLTVCSVSKGVLIVMPDDTRLFIADRIAAAQRVFLNRKGIRALDYLIARAESYPVQKAFIDLPGHLQFIELTYGRVRVKVSDRVQIDYGKSRLECALEAQAADDRARYVLTNGRREYVIECATSCSVIYQMAFDLRLIIGRFFLLL